MDIFEVIKNDVSSHPIVLYMKGDKAQPMCRFSMDVVKVLNEYEVEYETRDVLADETLREAIKVFSDWPTLPQLYVNGEFVGGRDIVMEMHMGGELKSMLE